LSNNPQLLAYLLGGGEIVLIVLVGALLMFGKRLPEIGRSMGRSIVEFKKGLSGAGDEEKADSAAAPPTKSEQNAGKSS